MNSSDLPLIIFLLAIPIIPLVICLIYNLMYRKSKKYVLEHSIAIKEIISLSRKYTFYSIDPLHAHRKVQNSLAAFRRIDYTTELLNYVKSNQSFFLEQIRKATENEKNYNQYCLEFNHIQATQKTNWNSKLKKIQIIWLKQKAQEQWLVLM